MAYTSNGSALTFASKTLGVIRSISVDGTGKEIDITGLGDAADLFEVGTANKTVTAECYGVGNCTVGTSGAISVTFQGDSAGPTGTYICTQASPTARLNEPISYTYKFVKAAT